MKCRFLSFLFLIFLTRILYAQNEIYLQQLPDTFDFKKTAHIVSVLSQNITDQEKSGLVHYLIEEGFKRGRSEKNDTLVTFMNYYLGDCYYYEQDYNKALECYQLALPFFEEFNDTLMMAKTYNSIGVIYNYRRDNENTLKYYLKEIELLDQVKMRTPVMDKEKVVILTNLVNYYNAEKQYVKISELAPAAIAFAREINDSLRLASMLICMGNSLKNLNYIEESLDTFRLALEIFDDLGDGYHKAFIFINIGGVFEYINKPDSSILYYENALQIFRNEGFVYGELSALTGIAGIYALRGKYKEAREIYISCIDRARTHALNDILLDSYSALANIEYELAEYKKAYDFKELYNALNDSLYNIEKNKKYAELETKYETIQKENEINLLKAEKLKREEKLRKNRLFSGIALTVAFVLLIIFYIGYVFYNQKRKANKLLSEKNTQIELKNKQLSQMNQQIVQINKKLKQSQVELTVANNSKNRFFSILGHDLRNPFHSIMGQSYLLSKSYDKLSADERRQYANDIMISCEQVNRLLDNLLEWVKTQTEGVVVTPRKIEFFELVQDTLAVLKCSAIEKSIEITNNVGKGLWITADYSMVETIMRNLVNNSIKFTHVGGAISISAAIEDSMLTVDVSDNGVGISPENLERLFSVDSNIKTRGTNDERGTGLGLVICKEFVDLHKGKLWVESTPGQGSIFHFSIPVSS